MIRNSFILKFLALTALAAFFASPAAAERLSTRISQGNNIGATIGVGWGMPWGGSGRPWQFPRGSSNLIKNDGMTIGYGVAQDLDGDGLAEDTTGTNHLRATVPELSSLESYDLITAIAGTGVIMEGEMTKSEYSRVWSSLDLEELADWPIEGRIPRGDPNGAPDVAAGGETMFFHSGDPFMGWGHDPGCTPPGGAYEWTLRFLDFAESNNMMYVNVFIRNMSEYVQFNHHDDYGAAGRAHPDGWTWKGMVTIANFRNMQFGPERMGWALHAEKRLYGMFAPTSTISDFTPPRAPLMGFKMINPPHTADQTMDMTSLHHHDWCSEFGFAGHKQFFVGFPWGMAYTVALDKETGYYPGVINVFTGEQIRGAWPGMLQPEDARYSQWIWAGPCYFMTYPCYGELLDIAPRDTVVFDAAYILTYPGLDDYVRPELDIAEIDNPIMQEVLAPLEDYAVIAEIVINSGYKLPETPKAPALTIIPGDREVTITWSDVNLQTPDTYYYFLEEQGLNPSGYYKEYDFEGFRFYRSFVGPSDSHSELLADYNVSSSNVVFYYIDRMQDDTGRWRMRDGMKVWYALVPYDRNYDTATGEMFSLPDPASGKTWNRPGATLYTLIPRSEASNYKTAELLGYSYVGPATVAAPTAELSGADGVLTEAPKWLEPQLDFEIEMVNNERITQDLTLYVSGTRRLLMVGRCRFLDPVTEIKLLDASRNDMGPAGTHLLNGYSDAELIIMNTPDDDGINYAIHVLYEETGTFIRAGKGNMHINLDPGTYTGATITPVTPKCNWGPHPTIQGMIRAGGFEVTWKGAGADVSVDVANNTRGITVPFGPYADEQVWGFMPGGTYMDFWDELADGVSQADRTNLLLETMPADNTDAFALYVNGIVWEFTEITAMPAAGAKFTTYACYGSWNDDGTVFTQRADPPDAGDEWKIEIKAMSLEPEDADLTKIKVVPNPYMASSFLDLSTNNRRIDFVNLPDKCTIRIYTLSGNLVNVLNHIGASRQGWGNFTNWDRINAQTGEPAVYTGYDNHGGTEPWNLRNRFGQTVASGLYFFHVTDQRGETHTGKFYIVN